MKVLTGVAIVCVAIPSLGLALGLAVRLFSWASGMAVEEEAALALYILLSIGFGYYFGWAFHQPQDGGL